MNMKIIQRRTHVEHVSYTRSFEYADMPGAGFGFDCDENGNVDTAKLNPCAADSYRRCLSDTMTRMEGVQWRSGEDGWEPIPGTGRRVPVRMIDQGAVRHVHSGYEPAIGLCECGRKVELHGFTNTCDCGADYNSAGQRLAPRIFWGEETGESLSDILSIDGTDTEALFE